MKIVILLAIVLVSVVVYTQAQGCTNQPRTPSCRGDRDEGRGGSNCRAGERFFFDTNSRSCRPMNFRGCGGNNNRFCRERDCTQACRQGGGNGGGNGGGGAEGCFNQPRTPNCRGGRDEGRGGGGCRAGRRFFFDGESRQCREMQFRGCGGNSNRFCSERDCNQACRQGGGNGGGEGDCSNQPRTPNCRGGRDEGRGGGGCRAGRRFFFDGESRQCREMQFRGCGGNSNRFCNQQSCQETCRR